MKKRKGKGGDGKRRGKGWEEMYRVGQKRAYIVYT